MSSSKIPVAIAKGDGIGPEIMEATLHILKQAGASLEYHEIEIGEKMYLRGCLSGLDPSTWDVIRNTKAFLKAPITTPQGGGFKSLNVTIRTTLGLYANVRPSVSYAPYIETKHPSMDVVIVRENEEDLYCGIEYQQTPQVCESLKYISRPGCEKIIRYAFEYARRHGRKKVTCFSKDNIMKISDGLFHKIYDELSKEYADITAEHWIVDIGAAKLADTPEAFDVIVMANLYGDILSDVAAQISGSVGLAGSANIGDHGAMFEAIHGSAPRRANQNLANPSGLLKGALLMLDHLGLMDTSVNIHNAWLKTIEDGIHTYDIFKEGVSKQKVGTKEFAEAVVKRLGQKPTHLKPIALLAKHAPYQSHPVSKPHTKRELVGVDVYLHFNEGALAIEKALTRHTFGHFELKMITNRGVRIYPNGQPETFCVDQYRCRFVNKDHKATQEQIIKLLNQLNTEHFDIIKTENLYYFDGKAAYSSAEG